MTQQRLSGTIVVIIIAIGVQACIIVFIFVKRQVQRFALRNRRGPHMSVGHGAPKALRREADRLLECVSYIRHEPPLQLLSDATVSADKRRDYRCQIVLNFQGLEADLADFSAAYIRPAGGNVRSHMLGCVHGGGPLAGAPTRLVHQVCDDYDAARHHYDPIDRHRCKVFVERMDRLRAVVRANKLVKPHQPVPAAPLAAAADSAEVRRRKQPKLTRQPSISADPAESVGKQPSGSSDLGVVSSIVSVGNQSTLSAAKQPPPNVV